MHKNYWRSNLKILLVLIIIWFIVSFGFGIIWSDYLDQFQIGGFKVGFWFAQQGSIYFFVLLPYFHFLKEIIHLLNKLIQGNNFKYKSSINLYM